MKNQNYCKKISGAMDIIAKQNMTMIIMSTKLIAKFCGNNNNRKKMGCHEQ